MTTSTRQSTAFLPYGRQSVTEDDIHAVEQVLRSDRWTQGDLGPRFERILADVCGATEAVLVSSGTAALHLSMLALGVGPGDVIVTSANTFLASANCARYVGAEVLFADIDPATGLMTPNTLARVLDRDTERRVRAIVPVHFAGQSVEMAAIASLAREHGARVVVDACHALGATYQHAGQVYPVGCSAHADLTVFSFHPVKHVAMGEGGAVTTDDRDLAGRLRLLRNHGLQRDNPANLELALDCNGQANPWYYEMTDLGYNYRATDIQAGLGCSQLGRLGEAIRRRNEIARLYKSLLKQRLDAARVTPLRAPADGLHAYHLYVVKVDYESYGLTRADLMNSLSQRGIGTQVHYIPVPWQPYYRDRYGLGNDMYPGASAYYEQALSLPMYPALTNSDCHRVVDELAACLETGNDL
ncbi:MAG: UDP-4-amino-4,6-dideoxy-N-acetyl-beta-L-altrosamine transaminase [bacterium]